MREKIVINAPPASVWKLLENPGNLPAWNPKCQSSTGRAGMQQGASFSARVTLGREERHTDCEIRDFSPGERIVIRYSGGAFGSSGGFVDETFALTPLPGGRTQLTLEVDFRNSGLPFFVRVLMGFAHTFGHHVGRSSLDGIRDLISEEV